MCTKNEEVIQSWRKAEGKEFKMRLCGMVMAKKQRGRVQTRGSLMTCGGEAGEKQLDEYYVERRILKTLHSGAKDIENVTQCTVWEKREVNQNHEISER